jgi:outer membrane protein assembly factor BamB
MKAGHLSTGRLHPASPLADSFARSLWLILLSLSMAAGAATLPVVSPAPSKTPLWPVFRGNAALTGVAIDSLLPTNTLLWTFKTGAAVKSSAVIGTDKVFIGSDDGNLYALNFADGKQMWAFKAAEAIQAPPLLADNMVFAGSVDGLFYALDAASGSLVWKIQTDGKVQASASAFVGSNGLTRILFGSYDFKLRCLDAGKGTLLWSYESGNYINGASAVADGQAVFGGCDAMVHVLRLEDGVETAQIDAGAYIPVSVALAGHRAYFGHYDNEFLCVDLAGTNVAWKYHDRDFPYLSSAAVTTDRVVFGGDDKTLHCLNRADGKSIWSFASQGKIQSSPVVAGDKVVFGSDDGRVYLVSMQDGHELWSYDTGQPVNSSPAVAAKKIVIGCDDGNVYCFGANKL